jgi:hypothetical protein
MRKRNPTKSAAISKQIPVCNRNPTCGEPTDETGRKYPEQPPFTLTPSLSRRGRGEVQATPRANRKFVMASQKVVIYCVIVLSRALEILLV